MEKEEKIIPCIMWKKGVKHEKDCWKQKWKVREGGRKKSEKDAVNLSKEQPKLFFRDMYMEMAK